MVGKVTVEDTVLVHTSPLSARLTPMRYFTSPSRHLQMSYRPSPPHLLKEPPRAALQTHHRSSGLYARNVLSHSSEVQGAGSPVSPEDARKAPVSRPATTSGGSLACCSIVKSVCDVLPASGSVSSSLSKDATHSTPGPTEYLHFNTISAKSLFQIRSPCQILRVRISTSL